MFVGVPLEKRLPSYIATVRGGLLGLFISIGEKLFQGYKQKSFLVIGKLKENMESRQNLFLVRPQYCPHFFSQSSVFQNAG